MLEKSKEAFIMAIEIFNKPTLKYRVEGFSFFICNAWELMLKAKMIQDFGANSIYYKNNPERTLALSDCIERVFTNNKDPLRINLEKVVDLRNTSTHFVTTHYEYIYVPLFQSCVKNYASKMMEFFNINTNNDIPYHHLNLSTKWISENENMDEIYFDSNIKERYNKNGQEINKLIEELDTPSFSLKIIHEYHITKKPGANATEVSIAKDAETQIKIVKELKDPANTHPYTTKECIAQINERLKRENINLQNTKENSKLFNKNDFQTFIKFYNLKQDDKYCYSHIHGSQHLYKYSFATIELMLAEIKKDPECIIQNLNQQLKKQS